MGTDFRAQQFPDGKPSFNEIEDIFIFNMNDSILFNRQAKCIQSDQVHFVQ